MPQRKYKPKDFKRIKAAEQKYARQLRKIAAEVGRIIDSFAVTKNLGKLQSALRKYAEILQPWAVSRAATMVTEVDFQSRRQWRAATQELGRGIKEELARAPTGLALRQMMAENVRLITSLPIEAGDRVQKIIIQGLSGSKRAEEVAKQILKSGHVTKSRATLIARTETARAQGTFTQVRAQSIGADSYIWQTAEDEDVRASHRKLDGKVFKWNDPPECDPGIRANPGGTYNCRCIAIPIIPETII